MKQQIEKIKTHLKENKAAYITGAVCLVVGVVSGVFISRKINTSYNENQFRSEDRLLTKDSVEDRLLTNTQTITGSNYVGGDNYGSITSNPPAHQLSYIVQQDGTDNWWRSQADYARERGVFESDVSKHLTTGKPLPNGETLSRRGIAIAA